MKAGWAIVCLAGLVLAACARQPQPPVSPDPYAPRFEQRSLSSRWFGSRFDRTLMKEDFRAVSLSVDASQLGEVRTGDRVDLISVFEAARPRGAVEKVAATVLQNAEVLGAREGTGGGKGVLMLRLNPLEAQYAALAVEQGPVYVIIRKEGDIVVHPLEMAAFRNLFL